ncbi:Conserved_hypothetical protein [Hexamita inflata]|uniref:Uncharacterized protein n=1 Tax=Hexamita inflata TaxID=28002 RepID=A0AA86RAF3_9EUKA|nr:Conserved hypothetical protein [Hexamita inflata]
MLASIILVKQLTYNTHSMCANKIINNNNQYNYCQNSKYQNNQLILNEIYFQQQYRTQLFIHVESTQKSVIDIQVYNYNVNIFVLFGLGSGSQNVVDSEINISLNFPVFQGALICLQCNVYVTNCTLVFVATGKAISCVLGEVLNEVSIQQTFIQFRISSSNSSGIVNKVSNSPVNFSITDCKLTGGNLIESGYNGYISSFVLMPITILVDSFQVCVGNTSSFGNQSATISQSKTEVHFCDMCGAQFVVYGLCLDSLKHGTQVGGVLQCDYPFIFLDNQCFCDQGYVLDSLTCVNILQALLNVTSTDTSALQKRVDDVAAGLLDLDTRIYNNASEQYAQIGNTQLDLESQISSNVSMLNNQIQANALALENSIASNTSSLLNSLQLTQDALEQYIIDNATVLDWRIYYNVSALNQSILNISQIMELNLHQIQLNLSSFDANMSDFKQNQSQLISDLEIIYQQQIDEIESNISYFVRYINCTNVIGQQFVNDTCLNVSCSIFGQLRVNGICSCPNQNAIVQNSSCVCPKDSSLIGLTCTCPTYSSLINDECVCDAITGRIKKNGACVCPVGQIEDNNLCKSITCPPDSNLDNGVCVCNVISGQVMDNGECKCSTVGAFVYGSACTCGEDSTNISNTCGCPANSALVSGICTCNKISGQIMNSGECKCQTQGALIDDNQCTCGVNGLNISNSCSCPINSTYIGNTCTCTVNIGESLVFGVCQCQDGYVLLNGTCQLIKIININNISCQQAVYYNNFDIQTVSYQVISASNFTNFYVFNNVTTIQNAFINILDGVYSGYINPLFQNQTTYTGIKIQLGQQIFNNNALISIQNSLIINQMKIISLEGKQLMVNSGSPCIIQQSVYNGIINDLTINLSYAMSQGNITLTRSIQHTNITGYQLFGMYQSNRIIAMLTLEGANIRVSKTTIQPEFFDCGNGSYLVYYLNPYNYMYINDIAIIVGNSSQNLILQMCNSFGIILFQQQSNTTINISNSIIDSYLQVSGFKYFGLVASISSKSNITVSQICMQFSIINILTLNFFGLIGENKGQNATLSQLSIIMTIQGNRSIYSGLFGIDDGIQSQLFNIILQQNLNIQNSSSYVGTLYGIQQSNISLIVNCSIMDSNISQVIASSGSFLTINNLQVENSILQGNTCSAIVGSYTGKSGRQVQILNSNIVKCNSISKYQYSAGFIGVGDLYQSKIIIYDSNVIQCNIQAVSSRAGGFIGAVLSQEVDIQNSSVMLTNISGLSEVGGLIGFFSPSFGTSQILNSNIKSIIIIANSSFGVVIGKSEKPINITNSFTNGLNYVNSILQLNCTQITNVALLPGC